jgi:DNA-directed RNA polymerase subunit RPC12/RpoP
MAGASPYDLGMVYCGSCARYVEKISENRCPRCGGRVKTKPKNPRKKAGNSQGDKPILYNGAWRCGNCKSRLIIVAGVFRCTNEYCGMKYDAEKALAEAMLS